MSGTIESKPKLPGFISLLLVIALGISLSKLMWLVITPQQKAVFTPQNSQVAIISQKEPTNYGKLIADQHIFGEVIIKKTPVVANKEPVKIVKPAAPKVKINAKLHGIVAYKSKEGFALISNKNGPQKVYGKGDTLQDGVTISSILPTKVLLDNNGTTEELLLPAKLDKKDSKVSKRSNNRTAARLEKTNPSRPVANAAQTPDLNQFRQEILSNPNKLTDIVRASPAIINGQFTGFRIRSGKNRKLFRELNFRANDIITEVNGIVLDDANKGVQVLAELESATSLSIKVRRGNEDVFIDHSF